MFWALPVLHDAVRTFPLNIVIDIQSGKSHNDAMKSIIHQYGLSVWLNVVIQ
jgi:hypothetical protein